jgi:uncharacterized protein with von Willebrand factor type A (vWA) domain
MGLNFGSANMLDLVRATEDVPVGHKQDFRHAARCLLVHRKSDLPLFDEAFQVFWRRPSAEQTTRDLRAMGEQRRYGAPQVRPASGDEEGQAQDGESSANDSAQPAVDLTRTFSAREVLRAKDFAHFTTDEMEQARQMMAELAWDLGRRRSRRMIPGPGSQVDLRRTFRRNLKHGGELLELAHRQLKTKPRSLVLICDVSGSMERYTRMLLHFSHSVAGHSVAGELGQVEAFLFATRLTRITRQLNHRSVDEAVTQVSRAVPDWAGGTRIGETLRSFNFQWSRRIPVSKGVVLIISDGWDRGEPELLSREMARLQRSCRRLIWLNPLLGSPTFEPLTQGLQAALPYVDNFLPVHNIDSLQALARHLNDLEPRKQLSSFGVHAGRVHANTPETVDGDLESQGTAKPRREINPALASTFRHPLWGQRRT